MRKKDVVIEKNKGTKAAYLAGSTTHACTKATEAGLTVVEGNDLTLLLDLDSAEAFNQFKRALPVLLDYIPYKNYSVYVSRSGLPHRHVIMNLFYPLSAYERIALQACLGSDSTREMLSLFGVQADIPKSIVLFVKGE